MELAIRGFGLAEMFMYFIYTAMTLGVMIYTVNSILELKPAFKKLKIFPFMLLGLCSVVVFIYDYFFEGALLYFQNYFRMIVLVAALISLLLIFYKDRPGKITAIAVISIFINSFSSYFMYYMYLLFNRMDLVMYAPILSANAFIHQTIVFSLLVVTSFFVIKFMRRIPADVPQRYWSILAVMEAMLGSISIILWDYQLGAKFNILQNIYSSVMVLFLLLVGILTVRMFSEITVFYTKEKQSFLIATQNTALLRQLETENAMNENLRAFKHDINGVLTALYVLAENGQTGEIRRIISGQFQMLAENSRLVYTGNPLIDALLNLKLTQIQKRSIQVQTELAPLQAELPFEPTNICSILLNLLENAMEACEKLQKEHKPSFIYLKICIYKNHLCIIVKNSYNGVLVLQDDHLGTSKPDSRLHGFGIKNVEYYVKRYNGIFRFDYTENEFTVKVMMPL